MLRRRTHTIGPEPNEVVVVCDEILSERDRPLTRFRADVDARTRDTYLITHYTVPFDGAPFNAYFLPFYA